MSDRLTPEREAEIPDPGDPITAGRQLSLLELMDDRAASVVSPVLAAVLDEAERLRARVTELEDQRDRYRAQLVALRNDALNMRGALAPNGQERKVPFPLGETLAPAVEWLIAQVAELAAVRAERDLAQRKVASLKAQQDKDDAEYAAVIAERDSAREALRDAGDQIAALESDLGGATARIAELTAERHATNEALDDAVRELRRRDLLHTQTAEEASHG